MKPDVPSVLTDLARLVAVNAAPDVPPADRAANLGMTSALLHVAAAAWDAAAENLVAENRAIRSLLKAGAALAPEFGALAEGADDNLRLSALSAANAILRQGLIDLHASLEDRDDPQARSLVEAIWAELGASTERRMAPGSPV